MASKIKIAEYTVLGSRLKKLHGSKAVLTISFIENGVRSSPIKMFYVNGNVEARNLAYEQSAKPWNF